MKRLAALILAAAMCGGCYPIDPVASPEGPVGHVILPEVQQ